MITFWLILTVVSLVWYTTVTVYVAIRGTVDIKDMLESLANRGNANEAESHEDS